MKMMMRLLHLDGRDRARQNGKTLSDTGNIPRHRKIPVLTGRHVEMFFYRNHPKYFAEISYRCHSIKQWDIQIFFFVCVQTCSLPAEPFIKEERALGQ